MWHSVTTFPNVLSISVWIVDVFLKQRPRVSPYGQSEFLRYSSYLQWAQCFSKAGWTLVNMVSGNPLAHNWLGLTWWNYLPEATWVINKGTVLWDIMWSALPGYTLSRVDYGYEVSRHTRCYFRVRIFLKDKTMALFVLLAKVCQMLSWWTNNSHYSINSRDTVSKVLPLCSLHQAPSYEPNPTLLASLWEIVLKMWD